LKRPPTAPPTHPRRKKRHSSHLPREREFFIDNLLVRIHLIIVMIRRTGLAPWESFPGSHTSTFLAHLSTHTSRHPRRPLPSECGTSKTVMARFWPLPSRLKSFLFLGRALFALRGHNPKTKRKWLARQAKAARARGGARARIGTRERVIYSQPTGPGSLTFTFLVSGPRALHHAKRLHAWDFNIWTRI